MRALAGIETALEMAERARGELRGLAASSAKARAVLGAADEDIAAMRADRQRVLERLDASRSYYSELVERSSRYFRPYLARSLPGLLDRTRGAAVLERRMVEDAEKFVEHATGDGLARAERLPMKALGVMRTRRFGIGRDCGICGGYRGTAGVVGGFGAFDRGQVGARLQRRAMLCGARRSG